MAANLMSRDWRLQWAFPALGRVPTTLPWRYAHWIGRDPKPVRDATLAFLQQRFLQVFPQATTQQHLQWARAHLDMLAQEMLDACALHRLGMPSGPHVAVSGFEYAQALQQQRQGFILVFNHYDRLMAGAIALARRGIQLHIMTMPIVDNPDLSAVQRDFLVNKIKAYVSITGGQWRTSNEGLRPVHGGLRSGQAWAILADAWRPEFGRLREHAFLGGYLSLPTGIERLAQSANVPMLHAVTRSVTADSLEVCVEPLPREPKAAIDSVIRALDNDVRERPWAWWQWGQWDQMWTPPKQEGVL